MFSESLLCRLSIFCHVDFKILIYKAHNSQGPSYIANSLVHDLPLRTLGSSAAYLLEVPSKHRKKCSLW